MILDACFDVHVDVVAMHEVDVVLVVVLVLERVFVSALMYVVQMLL